MITTLYSKNQTQILQILLRTFFAKNKGFYQEGNKKNFLDPCIGFIHELTKPNCMIKFKQYAFKENGKLFFFINFISNS